MGMFVRETKAVAVDTKITDNFCIIYINIITFFGNNFWLFGKYAKEIFQIDSLIIRARLFSFEVILSEFFAIKLNTVGY